MRQKIQNHIERIQQHPEHKKVRVVFLYTIIASVIVILVWAFLLLPAQLQLAA